MNTVTNKKNIFIALVTHLLIFLFVYTAISKLTNRAAFSVMLHQSPLIQHWSELVSWVIPIVELSIAGTLLFPATRLAGLFSSLLLLIIFTTYIGYMIIFTPNLPCSCGGVIKGLTWTQHLAFNLFFIAVAFTGILIEYKTRYTISKAVMKFYT